MFENVLVQYKPIVPMILCNKSFENFNIFYYFLLTANNLSINKIINPLIKVKK